MKPVLETEHLRVVFKGRRKQREVVAIDDLTMSVNEGEVIGFVGPNGAGKTTTIKVLMGFIFPTSGAARVLGYEAGSILARSRIGYLPEVALYYPFMTSEEILKLYGTLQGIRKKEMGELIPRLISLVGLAGFERLSLRNFSKGMLQRVGLAQAIMGDPDLLILDEVTSGLDPVGRMDLRDILRDFKDKGKTIFFSSHELSEVAKVCDRIILIDGGKVIQEKSMQEILESQKLYRVRIEVDGTLPSVPAEVRATHYGQNLYELETNSQEVQRALLRQLRESEVKVLETESQDGSLEDYFVKTVGHKIT